MRGLCPTISNSLRVFRKEFYRQNLGQRLHVVWLSLVGGDAPGILCPAWSYHPPPELGDLVPAAAAAAAAKLLQLCPTLCDPIDGSPPGFPVPGILQARTLEWVAISFSNAWKWKVEVKSLSRIWLLVTPWTACSLPGSSVHGIFQERVLEWAFSLVPAEKLKDIVLHWIHSLRRNTEP